MGPKVKEFLKHWACSIVLFSSLAVLMFVVQLIHTFGGR